MKNLWLLLLLALLGIAHSLCSAAAHSRTDKDTTPCTTCNKKELPYSFKHKMKTKVTPTMVDPQYAYDKFMKTKNKYEDISSYLGKFDTKHFTLQNNGIWEELSNGDRVWRLTISTKSNLVTSFGFSAEKVSIPEGAKLFVYSPDKKYVAGPITKPNNEGNKSLLVNSIPSKTICLEYYEPKAQQNKSIININALLYRFVEHPYGTTHKIKGNVTFINPFDPKREELTIEEQKTAKNGESRGGSTGAIYIDILEKGQWTTLRNGDRICRMGFESSIAYSLLFSMHIKIPKGGYVAAYATDGLYVSSLHHEPSNSNTNWLDMYPMPGNKYIVEYYEPKQQKGKGKVIVKNINTDLTKLWSYNDRSSSQPDSLLCMPNTICDCDDLNYNPNTLSDAFCGTNLWQMVDTLKRSVVRIQMFYPCSNPNGPNCIPSEVDTTVKVYDPNSKYYCTGALINNASGDTYLLAANHCITKPTQWNNSVIFPAPGDKLYFIYNFLFETDTCDRVLLPNNSAAIAKSIKTGGTVLATNVVGDFLLVKLNETPLPTYNPYYAGWDAATKPIPPKGLGIHHPHGSDKRYAIQDDDINLWVNNPNNGIKTFGTSLANQLSEITSTNPDGEMFALTFDRGVTKSGSSGSPYFNENGKIIGMLSGGYSHCNIQTDTTLMPNGNDNKMDYYGRLWYSYDKYHAIPNQFGGPLINVSSDGTIDATEREKTLKYWLQDFDNDPTNDGMMDGLEVTDCEIYLKDNPWDTPNNEPNQTALIDNSWHDIWESPDLWNSTVPEFTSVNSTNFTTVLSPDNEEPDFIDNDSGDMLDNYLRYNVRNESNCISAPASLHLYWTIASTGEMWPDHWINHYVDNDCLVGQEITTYSNGDPYPITIDPLNPNETWEGYIQWKPTNFTDLDADSNYLYIDIANCPSIDADVDNNTKIELCLLARLQSLDNPIFGIETSDLTQNVLNSNNIVTRNTFLADPGIVGMTQDGSGTVGNVISYGHPSIILITNNNQTPENLDIVLDKISQGNTEALQQLMYIELIPGNELWEKWESTGFKGEGIQIVAEKVIRVTNLETAKLLDIPFDAKEFEPLKIKVTIISQAGKSPIPQELPNEYKFRISHQSAQANKNINSPTDCLFTVKDLAKYGSTPIATKLSMNCYPNPFKDELTITFNLPNSSTVQLALYDIQGKLLKRIVEHLYLPAGLNTYQLNSNDMPNGIYICHLIADKMVATKKVVKQ